MTPHFVIRGGNPLFGKIRADGMKNAALPILFALLLVRGEVFLENLPPVTDIETTLAILSAMGAEIKRESPTCVCIDTSRVAPEAVPLDLTTRLRGSCYLLGASLGRFGRAESGLPGGCNFGTRPLDQHFALFESLGASVEQTESKICTTAPRGLHGAQIEFPFPSVGATGNAILAAVCARGTTTVLNAAREPHIADLANFLNSCGAEISGAGTPVIRIRGVPALHGTRYRIVPDMIEAGTYLCAVCATGGKICIDNVCPQHLSAILSSLQKAGAEITLSESSVTLERGGRLLGTVLETAPYPGFPTDMQAQFAPLLCLSETGGRIYERVWKNRFQYTAELVRMGATVSLDRDFAEFAGRDCLIGASVRATDLRGGAALLIAGLCAAGETRLFDIHHLERGYPNLMEKCRALGAEIETCI